MITIKENQLTAYKDGQAIPLPYFTNADSDDVAELKSAKLTNRNLLDNAWFTVNQRGATNYTSANYTVDRWRINSNISNLAVGTDGVTITSVANGRLTQRVDRTPQWHNKTVTLSAIINNILVQKTFSFPSATDGNRNELTFVITDNISFTIGDFNNYNGFTIEQIEIVFSASGTYDVKAVKLELGSVSTLANDVAPNYTTELLKCQRYYCIAYVSSWTVSQWNMATDAYVFPTQMRAIPTVTIKSPETEQIGKFDIWGNGQWDAIECGQGYSSISTTLICFSNANGTNIVGKPIRVMALLSADL